MGHPIVTNKDFVEYLFSAMSGGNEALLKLLVIYCYSFNSRKTKCLWLAML